MKPPWGSDARRCRATGGSGRGGAWAWLTLGTVLAVGAAWSTAAEPPPRLPLEWPGVWERALPEAVWDARPGPDGRVWLSVRVVEPPPPLDAVKAGIEREFRAELPQVLGATLLGFDGVGRVWLSYPPEAARSSGGRVLAYDGERWLDEPDDARVAGAPVTVGRFTLLPGRAGVGVFDGRAWAVARRLHGTTAAARVCVEPGGRSAVVFFPHEHPLHRFAEGVWVPLGSPATIARISDLDALVQLAATRDGVLGLLRDGTLLRLDDPPAALTPDDEAAVDRLLEAARSAPAAERDAAVAGLVRLGRAVLPRVAAALEATADPEARLTLRRVSLQLSRAAAPAAAAREPGPPELGDLVVEKATALTQLADGVVLVGVAQGHRATDGTALHPGLAVAPVDAPPYFIGGTLAANAGSVPALLGQRPAPRPVRVKAGTWWLPGHGAVRVLRQGEGQRVWRATPPLLLRLDPRTVTPAEDDEVLLAVDRAGRRFLGTTRQGTLDDALAMVKVVTPGAPDDRRMLAVSEGFALAAHRRSFDIPEPLVWLDDEGRLLAVLDDRRVHRFDGTSWERRDDVPQLDVQHPIIASPSGALLARGESGMILLAPDCRDSAEKIEELIERHAPRLAAHFRGGSVPLPSNQLHQLCADARGNLWLQDRHDVSVWTGSAWLDARTDALRDLSRRGGDPRIVPLGPGVYVTSGSGRYLLAYFARVENDAVVFEEAPLSQPGGWPVVRDADAGAWLATHRETPRGGGRAWVYGAVRISADGRTVQHVEGLGRPALHDGAGNLLLIDPDRQWPPPAPLHLLRDGRRVHSFTVPYRRAGAPATDRPGSIFFPTCQGLAHVAAADPADHPEGYRVVGVYHLPAALGDVEQIAASPRGFLALVTQRREQLWVRTAPRP